MTSAGKYFISGMLLSGAVLAAIMIAYPHLPSTIATHWNLDNQANGYSPKWALFLIGPVSMVVLTCLMYLLPWLSPKGFEINGFRSVFFQVMLMIIATVAYANVAILWVATGHRINVAQTALFGLCLLFILLGNLMGKFRRNFYLGVRTPWTLANERVWNATHRFAAKSFVAAGLLGVVLTVVGLNGVLIFATLLAGALSPVAYSLLYYKILEHRDEI